jgi:hypothetical protein
MNRGVSLINVKILTANNIKLEIHKQGDISVSNFLKTSLPELLGAILSRI